MLKVAVTDIGQLTDFDYDRQKPGPARSSGQLAAWRQWPCRLRQAMTSRVRSQCYNRRQVPAGVPGAWRTCGSFTSWTQFDTPSTTQRTIDVPVSDSVPDLSWLADHLYSLTASRSASFTTLSSSGSGIHNRPIRSLTSHSGRHAPSRSLALRRRFAGLARFPARGEFCVRPVLAAFDDEWYGAHDVCGVTSAASAGRLVPG